ncbi:MAG: tRNA uridine-5-carboxymethylaminomethyl(34) synthesis enzyme MnmG [Candidatus Omnitrophica bacterium]|nr:tRNA uridine-5-carboxymethylaminomethyl(34) synthesis enzyme MnmG [Candidatus Omnitrophota bacterium]
MSIQKIYDCIIIGGGHAGVEAALAPARMGCKTLMITLSFDTIGQMSCNPAIGGVGKGQIVKEIDALGGEMAIAADKTAIQFRQLNSSKGQAVRSSRCQSDRVLYKEYMQRVVAAQENLDVLEDMAAELIVDNNEIKGVVTEGGVEIKAKTVIITAGTFLNGRMHCGPEITPGGRIGEPASIRLAQSLESLGFKILTFKTGTPPRIDGKTINFDKLIPQSSDEKPVPFSFKTGSIPKDKKLLCCYITHTSEKTHDIIKANMHLSPMYSGQITNATGVRYCPSIEDKLKKFPDRQTHQVFLEPDGLDADIYYPNGVSTGLPADVQVEMIHSIRGLEDADMLLPGYSIEHSVIPPTELTPCLETKRIKGLFLAGQVNGTTGYEEAAGQGIIAGINAALKVKGNEPFILGRDEAYIGVLIDDLVTKGTEEPYRMFTSRVEYRLIVREDNADKRLCKYGYEFGLLDKEYYEKVCSKYRAIEEELECLRSNKVSPTEEINEELKKRNSSLLKYPEYLSDLLKRPEVNYKMIALFRGKKEMLTDCMIESIEYEIKYEGFIARQFKDVEKFKHIEHIKIPKDINYDEISSISNEIRQKLKTFEPVNLGQANRISGVTPAAISILMIYIKKMKLESNRDKNNANEY